MNARATLKASPITEDKDPSKISGIRRRPSKEMSRTVRGIGVVDMQALVKHAFDTLDVDGDDETEVDEHDRPTAVLPPSIETRAASAQTVPQVRAYRAEKSSRPGSLVPGERTSFEQWSPALVETRPANDPPSVLASLSRQTFTLRSWQLGALLVAEMVVMAAMIALFWWLS